MDSIVIEEESIVELKEFYSQYIEIEVNDTIHDILEKVHKAIVLKKINIDEIGNNVNIKGKTNIAYEFHDLKLGTRVSVKYYPSSQKHIEYYNNYASEGIIIFISGMFDDDNEESNFIILKDNGSFQTYRRLGSHFMGMADCYNGYYDIK